MEIQNNLLQAAVLKDMLNNYLKEICWKAHIQDTVNGVVKDTHGKDPREGHLRCMYLLVPSYPHKLTILNCFFNFDTKSSSVINLYQECNHISASKICGILLKVLRSQEAVILHKVLEKFPFAICPFKAILVSDYLILLPLMQNSV